MWPEDIADPGAVGVAMYELVRDLYPLPRSITGDGLRKTLAYLVDLIPIELYEVPSGTPVLDWTVPREWNVREAWIQGPDGRRVVDLADSTLHLVSYSVPIRGTFSLAELRPHLHTLPDHPEWIPYRTSYYEEGWGFCLAHRVLESMPEGEYEVCIDTTPGAWAPHLRRMRDPGRDRGRGADLVSRLPPGPGQRQPLRRGAGGRAGPGPPGTA